jgi:AcrR family transcriptional regulator
MRAGSVKATTGSRGTGSGVRQQERGPADGGLAALPDRRRQPSGDGARRRAMEAAIGAIAEVGADRVRMVDIAARAGMSTGHILYHFGRKARLLLEVLSWSENDLTDELRNDLARLKSPRRKLRRFVEAYLPSKQGDERWALWTQVIARPPADEPSRRLLDSFSQTWEDLLAEIVASGVQPDQFPQPDLGEFVLRSRAMLDGLSLEIMSGSTRMTVASAQAFAVRAMERELWADARADLQRHEDKHSSRKP